MNTETLTELKALNNRIGKLVDLFDEEQVHRKLMSLVGMCYVANADTGIIATKIIKVEVANGVTITNGVKNRHIIMYVDRVEASRGRGDIRVLVFENRPMFYTTQQALRAAEFEGFDLMKVAQFDHLKTVAKHRQDSVWNDLCESSAV